MQFVKTDGGMRSSGFAEHNDCAVRAYALFKDIPYNEAHCIFKKLGRRDGRGTKNHIIYDLIGRNSRKDGAGMTLNQLIAANPTGKVYGLKRGHAFAIINGVLHDSWKVGGKSRITFYWTDSVASAPTPIDEKPVNTTSAATKRANARATFDRLNAYGTHTPYQIAKRIAEEWNITVANAQYYVSIFTGKR
jgi:hypothetical protein